MVFNKLFLYRDLLSMVPADEWHARSGIYGRHIPILVSKTARWEIDVVEFGMQYVLFSIR